MWNASRLILLNAAEVDPAPGSARAEDRWIVSRLQRAIGSVTSSLDSYEFAHAALELYRFFWSELCDWYLEIVKPRLYDGEPEAGATLLWILEQTLALAHPMTPFVTEEIYAYLRSVAGEKRPDMLVVHPFPEVEESLVDEEAEREVGASIELTRRVRRWRDLVGVAPASVLPARLADEGGKAPHELVARLSRLSFDGAEGEALASFGQLEILPSAEVDAAEVRRRIAERRETLREEVERAERKLENRGFVSNAPAEVVEAERRKLTTYRAELEELEG
jgi:valyl-tRNA synthetase